jgi:hypothetical protein
VNSVNSDFKVGRPAIKQMLIEINADIYVMPENTTLDIRILTTCG